MRIHVLQFDKKVGLGTFSVWTTALGCEITTWRCDLLQWPDDTASGPLILLGGYLGVGDRDRFPFLQQCADWLVEQIESDRQILAICLGSQLLAYALGAKVHSRTRQEKGIKQIALTEAGQRDPLFHGLPNPFFSFAWHNDSFDVPANSRHLARTDECPSQAFRYRNAWGVQFHPEVDAGIVADWCRRTGAGAEPLLRFRRKQQTYHSHAKQLLKNFISYCRSF